MRKLRLALAQINATVGDFDANVARVRETLAKAEALGAELVLFPELVLCGYPAEDLLLKSDFLEANRRALEALAPASRRVTAVVRFADPAAVGPAPAALRRPRRSGRRGLQRPRHPARAPRPRRLPQASPSQLRRLRREALLPIGSRAARAQPGRGAARRHDLRGHVVSGRP